MKKFLFSFLAFLMFTSVSFATCTQDCEKNIKKPSYNCEKSKNLEVENKSKCDFCPTDDDEYCEYNQCFFDKRFRRLKEKLCLSKKQETMADNLYTSYKSDMESICNKYRIQKNKVLDMIECHNQCWKDERKVLKEIKNEAKERTAYFKDDLKEILCKNQYRELKRYERSQKKKMRRIIKYGAIYKLPCTNCTKDCND